MDQTDMIPEAELHKVPAEDPDFEMYVDLMANCLTDMIYGAD
jgi:hypothetical protein